MCRFSQLVQPPITRQEIQQIEEKVICRTYKVTEKSFNSYMICHISDGVKCKLSLLKFILNNHHDNIFKGFNLMKDETIDGKEVIKQDQFYKLLKEYLRHS